MLRTFTYHMLTFVDTLSYCIQKHKKMHLIMIFVFSIWSLIIFIVFVGVKESITNEETPTNVDASSRMELKHVIWFHTPATNASTMVVDINLMWKNSQHAFFLKNNMRTISKEPKSLMHSNPTRVQDLTKHIWMFSNWEVNGPCSSVNITIRFKSWRSHVTNISSKECHHMVKSIPRSPSALCQD